MMRNALLLILLVGIGVAVFRLIKHRKPSVDPGPKPAPKPGPEPAPKPLGPPGDIPKPGPSVSPVPDPGVCKYHWEDQCASNCKKYFRIDTRGLDGCNVSGTYYKKDQEVKCYFFEDTKILGTWITKAKASGHFFMITIAISEVKCNVLEATCSYFNGDEGGVLTESMSLNTGDSSVVYVKDPKTQITYTLPLLVRKQMVKSKKFKSPIGDDIVLDWAPGGWTCAGLAMKDDTNFGTFKKGGHVTNAPTVAKTYTNVYNPDVKFSGANNLKFIADKATSIAMDFKSKQATVTVDKESATSELKTSGLSANDYQLLKIDSGMLALLNKLTVSQYTIPKYNATLLDAISKTQVNYTSDVITATHRDFRDNIHVDRRRVKTVTFSLGSSLGLRLPPTLNPDGSIDVSNWKSPDMTAVLSDGSRKTIWLKKPRMDDGLSVDSLKAAPDGQLKEVKMYGPKFLNPNTRKIEAPLLVTGKFEVTVPGVQLVKTGSTIHAKLDAKYWSDKLGGMKAEKLASISKIPPNAGTYVPIQLTNQGSFKVGSRPTFDLLPAPSLRFMPK